MSDRRAAGELRAVLFDMDGTLVETEQYWGEAMFELAARLGGRMSAAARASTVGSTMRRSMTILHADLGLVRTEEQLLADARWVEDRTAQLLGAGVSWCPGARELVTAVRAAGLRTALVTTTPRRLADIVLASIRADLDGDPFDVTVCGDEVPARKPDPAPYQQAMGALAVEPSECVVVEDSESGVAAGLAAGAAVLGVPTVQELAPAPGLTLRSGLVGVDVAGLAGVLARRDLVDATT
ncbi:MAG TPA: HAD family phosphatase [Blastococcus sp.]|nr:HAD family phosphatase [Blastococcus sp.]